MPPFTKRTNAQASATTPARTRRFCCTSLAIFFSDDAAQIMMQVGFLSACPFSQAGGRGVIALLPQSSKQEFNFGVNYPALAQEAACAAMSLTIFLQTPSPKRRPPLSPVKVRNEVATPESGSSLLPTRR